jgi:predicted extracellular nuclease
MKLAAMLLLAIIAAASCKAEDFKVMFYNVENFFDTFDDSLTSDEAFTPFGTNHWTRERFVLKRNNIYKTIIAAGKGSLPDVIGLCEVENRRVLRQLTEQTPLSKYSYGTVHYDSPDRRGIDVALLYRRDSFTVTASKAHPAGSRTRDILYVKGFTTNNDTLHFFVNHWPSKGGGAASEAGRMSAAAKLKTLVDSLFNANINANICIMGDFNDYPDSRPINLLDAKRENLGAGHLYNMSIHLQDEHRGTIKFQGRWELIDLFFVSGNLRFSERGLHCTPSSVEIFKADFLLKTSVGEGESLYRTYMGPRYMGGFSDHLPILIVFTRL